MVKKTYNYIAKGSIVFILLLLFVYSPLSSQNQHKKVLFLGNSYTASNNLPQWIADIADANGDTLSFQAITPGGQYLLSHASDNQVISAIQQGNWDYIILQEQSQIPVIPYHREDAMMPGADSLKYLRDTYSPNAQLMFFMTWGRENGGQQCALGYCSYPFANFFEYQDTLCWAYQSAADSVGASIAPVGEMWRQAYLQHQSSLPVLDLFSPDESHPDIQGTYLAALSIYACIFQTTTVTIPFVPSGVDASLDSLFREIVDQHIWPRFQEWRLPNISTSIPYHTKESFTIYPNPATNYIKVRAFSDREEFHYRVYNKLGQKVMQGETSEEISVANLEEGIYILQIHQKGNSPQSKAFIILE